MKRICIVIMFMFLFIPTIGWAACTVVDLSYTAASASFSDVKECADLIDTNSAYGATLNIQACGQGDCVWEDGITITKNIRIVGAGKNSTVLTNGRTYPCSTDAPYGSPSYCNLIRFKPDSTAIANIDSLSDTGIFEVQGIHFYDASQHSYVYPIQIHNGMWDHASTTPIKRIRIHDNKFTNTTAAVKIFGYVHGLFDNNELVHSGTHYSEGAGVGHWTYDLRHIGTAEAWYVEDNTFDGLSNSLFTLGAASSKGFSQVIRYNTVTDNTNTFQPWESHTPAPQFTEVYGNKIVSNGTLDPQIRGGIGLVFFNQTYNTDAVLFREEYSDYLYYTSDWSADMPPIAGECAYATAYDPRSGTSPQICNDSIDTGTDCTCKKVNHSYVWNNRWPDSTLIHGAKTTDAWNTDASQSNTGGTATLPELVEDREYFNHAASFNGSTGMGCGTASQMNAITPTLVNAGFWVTTQDNCGSLSTDNIGTNPTTPIDGTLYRWNGSEWVSYYTPYTYPHPLRGEADATAPTVTISTSNSTITSDILTVTGTSVDAVGVSGCKYRLGSAPDAGNGTACTGTASFSCATTGYASGSNTIYVGCYDAAGNYGSDSITVTFIHPTISGGISISGGSIQ
jgi:hypothetical protein